MKLFLTSVCLGLVAVFCTPIITAASPFRDVTQNNVAFEAIMFANDPANGAFLVGDRGGNFNPRRHMSKFEASRAFALAAGFRHVTTALPSNQRDLQNRALATWRPFLTSIASEYGRWPRAHDGEIAFLLYSGILTADDVRSFITKAGQNETHTLFLVSDAMLWTLRLTGEDEEYFEGAEAHNRAITRAELAIMLFEVLYEPSEETHFPFAIWHTPAIIYDFTNEANMETITISGRINEIRIDALSGITVQTADGSNFSFYVTSDVKDIFDLRVGMLITANVVGIRAHSINIWGSAF